MFHRIITAFVLAISFLVFGLLACPVQGQYAYFSKPTDTISIAGDISLSSAATIEARVWITDPTVNGNIYNQWADGLEDKHLFAPANGLGGVFYPINFARNLLPTANTTGEFHDIAFVYNGSEESLYLDGSLIASQSASGNIANYAYSVGAVGAIFRDGGIYSSFQGYIETLRVSDIARYSGNSYLAPTGYLASDGNTQLLYNFDELAGSTTISDLSGHGHTGTLGVGFQGATAPVLGVVAGVPEMNSGLVALLGFAVPIAICWKRRPWNRNGVVVADISVRRK